jgi:hypothetical protein
MTTETKLRGLWVLTILTLLWMTVMWGNDIGTIQSQKQTIDSLQNENFNISVQNGRYEITFDHLKEVNPKLGKEMEDWMSHNTE